MNYQLQAEIARVFPKSMLNRLSKSDVEKLRQCYPDLSPHYLEFLLHVGWGSLGDCFMLYNRPVMPDDIFGAEAGANLPGILLIGDDFSGTSLGMDSRQNWKLIEIDARMRPYLVSEQTIDEYVSNLIARN